MFELIYLLFELKIDYTSDEKTVCGISDEILKKYLSMYLRRIRGICLKKRKYSKYEGKSEVS